MTTAIEFAGLTVTFGRRWTRARATRAVDGLSLTVRQGDFLALIGPNGSGKTTAIRCALGLLPPTSGRVTVFGQPLVAGTAAFRDVVYVPEEAHYHDYLTVDEATRYYAALHGRPASDAELDAVYARLHLTSARHTRIATCSKGMKQKVGLAQCLLQRPRLLVLDEPMRGLDPVAVREFREVLSGLHQDGVTILMSSHVLPEVEQLATRVAILDAGRLLSVDALSALVTVDRAVYDVAVEGLGDLPDYLTVEAIDGVIVRGTVPQAQVHAFLELTRVQGATLHACGVRKRSLEDSLIRTLGEGRA